LYPMKWKFDKSPAPSAREIRSPRKFEKNKLVSLGFFTSHTNIVELIACEMNYKSLSIVIINSYINVNYESPMNQPINNNGSMLSQGVNLP
jgi:hypothetical protein